MEILRKDGESETVFIFCFPQRHTLPRTCVLFWIVLGYLLLLFVSKIFVIHLRVCFALCFFFVVVFCFVFCYLFFGFVFCFCFFNYDHTIM